MRGRQGGKGGFDGAPGGVGGMHDAPVAVPALAREVQWAVDGVIARGREDHTLAYQPADAVRPALDGEAHRPLVAQSGACGERVAHMRLERVVLVQYR